jgi:23S rRNA pseudouridine1911/1915/1917 synthase
MEPPSEQFVVELSLPQERFDTYLRGRFPAVSRGAWQRLIGEGAVRVNNKLVKPTHHPKAGERVEIRWPKPQPAVAQPEAMDLDILFEDDDLLVLNKPAGVVVHPAAGHTEHTLVNALLHHSAGRLSGIGGVARPGIIHRLDKETSGCLAVAKNDLAHVALAQAFADRRVDKIYLAIVCGKLACQEGHIRAPLARHPTHRKRMAVTQGEGRDAWTSYWVTENLTHATLIQARLHTGRTHQIRVHFQHLGHPLVGDLIYGKRHNRLLEEQTGWAVPRQMLHAWKLAFVHPRSQQPLAFEAPCPSDFTEVLQALRESAS